MAVNDDVRVRLSAEGLGEVLSALRTLKAEAQRTTAAAAKPAGNLQGAFAGLSSTLGGVSKMLGAIGIAVSAVQLVGFARQSADAAEEAGNLADSLSLSVEQLSALIVVARQANVPIAALQSSIVRYIQQSAELARGNATVANSFAEIGVHASELEGKDLAGQLEVIARGYARMPASIERTNALLDVFGKRALKLVPLLNDVADQGVDGIMKRARELGVVLNRDVEARVSAVNNNVALLGAQFQVLVQSVIAGAAPDLLKFFEQLGAAVVTNQKAFEGLGKAIAATLRYGLDAIIVFDQFLKISQSLDSMQVSWRSFFANVNTGLAVMQLNLQGRTAEARELTRAFNEQQANEFRALEERNARRGANAAAAARDLNPFVARSSGAGDSQAAEETARLQQQAVEQARARREVLLAAADREVAIARATARARQDADQRSYEAGLISVREYYARREQAVRDAAAAEIALLERRRAAEALNPDAAQRQQRLSEIDATLRATRAVKAIETEAQLADLAADRRRRELELAQQVYDIVRKTASTDAERHRNSIQEIEAEAQVLVRTLQQQGRDADEIERRRRQFTTSRIGNLEFEEARDQLDRALGDLQLVRQGIQDRVRAGQLTELQGENQLLAAERARLPQLLALADAMTTIAALSGDPERIAAAAQFRAQIHGIAAELQASELTFKRAATTFRGALESGLIDLLSEGRRETESWSDAFARLGASVASAVRQLAAVALVRQLFGDSAAGFSSGGLVPAAGFAGGGVVFGPGTSTSDSIPARLSAGEYVVRAAAVNRPGMLAFLDAINSGDLHRAQPFVFDDPARDLRFAEGGLVAGAGAEVSGTVTVGLEDGLVAREVSGPKGQRAILNVIARNPRAIRRALGLG